MRSIEEHETSDVSPVRMRLRALRHAATLATAALLAACGGGDGGSEPAAAPATRQPAALTAAALDTGASGTPVALRVALSASGDGYAVWRADSGGRHDLWASRYRADAAAWGPAVNIESRSADIGDFDLAVDAQGHAVVAWHEVDETRATAGSIVMANYSPLLGAWRAPAVLSGDARGPSLAASAQQVLALYAALHGQIRSRWIDPASGTLGAELVAEANNTGTGFSSDVVGLLRDDNRAVAAFNNQRTGAGIVASNFYDGQWQQLPENDAGLLGGVPGSFHMGAAGLLQLVAAGPRHALLAWEAARDWEPDPYPMEIRVSQFDEASQTWSQAQTLLPASAERPVRLQRLRSDGGGRALMLWTEQQPGRTALKAVRLNPNGTTCSPVTEIDAAVGGGAAGADLAVLPSGDALAVWQQFEGGRPDDGTLSNIGLNRFDAASGTWAEASLAEDGAGAAFSPSVSAAAGQALVGWLQAEGGTVRVKASLQALGGAPLP